MKFYLIVFCILILSTLPQSNANIISEDVDFEVTANFDQPGYQSWIITVLTPGNKTSSYDGCNTHFWAVDFDQSVISGSNYTLVILEDETIDEQLDISNYYTMENVSVVTNIEQNNSSLVFRNFPFDGGDPQKLKLVLYYEGSSVGSLNLTGILKEYQTLLACQTSNEIIYPQTLVLFTFVMIMIVRLRIDWSTT